MHDLKVEMRFAHSEGHTSLCYDDSSRHLLTCGTDGDFRIWNGIADEDPTSHHVGECAYAIAFKEGKVFVSTDANKVESYSFPDGAPLGMVARFTSTINHIHCSPNSQYLACGSADFSVKVIDLNDNSEKKFLGHDAPILSVALDPTHQYLASSSCDGTVRIWNIETADSLKTWTLLPKSNDFSNSKTLGRLSWHPDDGKFLAVPVNKEVHFYSRESWNKERVLKDEFFNEFISITSFSPCGLFLFIACTNGRMAVWNVQKNSIHKCEEHENKLPITDVAWGPTETKEIAFADNQGQIGTFKYMDEPKSNKSEKNIKDDMYADISDDEVNNLDLDAVKGTSFLDDEAESDDDIAEGSKGKSKVAKIEDDDDDDNGNVLDLGKIKAAYEPLIFGESGEADAAAKATEAKPEAPPRTVVVEKVMANVQQEAFQPSSTPTHFQHRYMLWNSVGLIRCYNTDEENSIDVEFHDVNVHHAIHIQNILNHTVAALSEEALVLAGPPEEDQPSKLVCMHFGTWDSTKEWTCDMPEGEAILAVATGRGWVCAVTDKRYLRLFSISGLQLNVVSLSGPVVCLTGMENSLLVVYHQSAGLTDEQHLSLIKFTIQKKNVFCSQPYPLPLSAKSTLSWLGFTDEGSACIVDSSGVVHLTTLKQGSFWSPIACLEDRNKGKSDHYFVIGLSEIQQQIRCILCKGSHYPATLPRPTLSVVPFQMPFCELTTDKGDNEEKLCRQFMLKALLTRLLKEDFQVENELEACQKKSIDQLLKVFALSVNANREFRAMEVAERMPSSHVVQGAIRYATMKKCLALAQRLGELAYAKEEEEMQGFEPDLDAEQEEEEEVSVPLKPRLSFSNATETVIQPKLMMGKVRRSSSFLRNGNSSDMEDSNSRENMQEDSQDNNDEQVVNNVNDTVSTPSEAKKNPFKVSSQKKQTNSGLDAVLEQSLEARASKVTPQPFKTAPKTSRKKASETGISPEARSNSKAAAPKKTSAFQLYLAKVKDALAEEFPELDEADIVKKAVADFKNLEGSEKQIWQEKASKSTPNVEEPSKKRKADGISLNLGTEQSKKSKPAAKGISDKTCSKINQFMFSKKD